MIRSFLLTALLMLGIGLAACSTTTYRIQSTPAEAEVHIQTANGSRKLLGRTPVTASAQDVNPQREPFKIEVKKDGYEPQSLMVMDSFFAKNVEATLTLQTSGTITESKDQNEAIDAVTAAVADIQKDIQTKNFDEGLSKINRLIAEHPRVATFYSLSGNIHYLQRRLDQALSSYKKAFALNPKLFEVQKMIEKIETLQGGTR